MNRTRRSVLQGAALAAAPMVLPAGEAALPVVPFGPQHRISRVTVGGNPVSGFSHYSPALDKEMLDYFTAANVKKLLRDCESAGINTWQSRGDRFILRMLREYRNEGGTIHWIAQTASEMADVPRNIRDCAAAGALGIYHHGSLTDALWQSGRIDEVYTRVKIMRDCGVRAGVATHIPEVVDYIETKGWDVDFYMTCLYNLSRTKEELASLPPGGPGERFVEEDRARMLERVRKTRKQCLIFKVYGAGRRTAALEDRQAALRQAFDSAKPQDCVVIGMFPKHSDQVHENVRLAVAAMQRS